MTPPMPRWTRIREDLRGVVWDWGDTLMRDIPGQAGPMVQWKRVEAMPGAASALEALSGLSVQCVASNATESDGPMIAAALERVGLRTHLTHFFTSMELGIRKPDPRFFLKVAQELGIPPAKLVAIGDDLRKDMIPAKAAGLATILVSQAGDPSARETVDLVVPSLTWLAEELSGGPGAVGAE